MINPKAFLRIFTYILLLFLNKPSYCFAEAWQIKSYPDSFQKDQTPFVHDIIQDHRGIIYFATDYGVIEYDGVSWITILLPKKGPATALGINSDGRVYVGGNEDLGYLVPEDNGHMSFTSIRNLIPKDALPSLKSCLSIQIMGQQVSFATEKALFLFDGKTFKIFPTTGLINNQIVVSGEIYFTESEKGLMTIVKDHLEPVPGGDFFRSQAMTLTAKNNVFVATSSSGLLDMNFAPTGVTFLPLPDQDLVKLNAHTVSKIIPYQGGYLIGMAKEGLLHLSSTGSSKPITPEITKKIGEDIFSMFIDRENDLWLGSEKGIFMVSLPNKMTDPKKDKIEFSALIRSMISTDDESTIFGGTFFEVKGGVQTIQASKLNFALLPFNKNDLRFNFTSNSLGQADEIQYQTFLEGFDNNWTNLSDRKFREFTNLVWKKYVFKVRAQKPDGTISADSVFSFRINPPWYEQYWFYSLQLFVLYTMMFCVVIFRIKKKHVHLESHINTIVVSTVSGYLFTKVGADSAISSISGGASFLYVMLGSLTGILLAPMQKRLAILVLKMESYIEQATRRFRERRRR